jgi:hypothetical protein
VLHTLDVYATQVCLRFLLRVLSRFRALCKFNADKVHVDTVLGSFGFSLSDLEPLFGRDITYVFNEHICKHCPRLKPLRYFHASL